MKKLLVILTALLAIGPAALSLQPAAAANVLSICNDPTYAQTHVCGSVGKQQSQNTKNPIISIFKTAIDIISYIAGIAAIILIVAAAIRFMTSGGSAEAVASARGELTYALVGILIIVIAQMLVAFVLDRVK